MSERILTTFKLTPADLADLQQIVDYLAADGLRVTRADALRWAVRQAIRRLPSRKKNPKKSADYT